ncbi:MAG: phosphatase PAP2 family protein [Pseudonocardia sp.]
MTADQDGVDRAPAGLSGPLPPPRRQLALHTFGVVLLGVLAAAALYVGAAGTGPTAADAAALDESIELRSGGLTLFATVLTHAGSTASMAVLALLVALWSLYHGRRVDAALVFGAMAGASLLFRGLKLLIDRPRPPLVSRLADVASESLPSGHATMSMVVIGTLVVLAWAGLGRAARGTMVAAAAVWVGGVGATRIYLGVHWFSDVVAGWLVGGAWLATCVAAWSWWRARRPTPRPTPPATNGTFVL